MADSKSTTTTRYADHEEHFRSHFRDQHKSGEGSTYSDYEPGYQSGYRFGTSDEHTGRSFDDLEPEMRRRHEKEHGEGTWSKVKHAARHAFKRGRSHRSSSPPGHRRDASTDSTSSSGTSTSTASGSSNTASGNPGSVMREDEGKRRRDT